MAASEGGSAAYRESETTEDDTTGENREEANPDTPGSRGERVDPRGSTLNGEPSNGSGSVSDRPASRHGEQSRMPSGSRRKSRSSTIGTTNSGDIVPPHDLEVEKAVLGSMLVSGSAVNAVSEVLTASDFYSENHRSIYSTLQSLMERGEAIDQLTLASELEKKAEYERIGGKEYIFELVESIPRAANARRYADIVRGKALLRYIGDAGLRIQQLSFSEPDDPFSAADEAERMLYEAVRHGNSHEDLRALEEVAPGTLEEIQTRYEEMESGDEVNDRAISGLPDVDALVGGHKDTDLVTLAARPAMGKSAWSIGTALATSSLGKPVAVFSLEMSNDQLVQRMVSQITSIPTTTLDSGQVPSDKWPELVRAVSQLGKLPIWLDESEALTPTSILAKARRLDARLRSASRTASHTESDDFKEQGLGLIIVDHIQLVEGGGRFGSRQEEISSISRGLKRLARSLGCPVLALSQLSRSVESRNDKRPLLSDLRESGSIEQDSDLVMFLYRDEYYNPESEDKGTAEVIIGKHRNGPTGKVMVSWLENRARFAGLARGVNREGA